MEGLALSFDVDEKRLAWYLGDGMQFVFGRDMVVGINFGDQLSCDVIIILIQGLSYLFVMLMITLVSFSGSLDGMNENTWIGR